MQKLNCSSEEIADKLDKTQWANGFSWEQMKRLCGFFQVCSAPGGHIIFEQGVSDNAMGILLKGRLNVVRYQDGKRSQLAKVRAPQTFGELSLIDGQPRSAHIIAAEDVEFALLTKDRMEEMAKEYPMVAYRMLWKISYLLSQRLRSTSGQLAEYLELVPS